MTHRTRDVDVSVAVPVYRNAGTLRELHARISSVLSAERLSFELLFVDDACPDGSLAVLRELQRSDARVRVLALDRNVGQHRAVLAGLEMARGNCTVILDADLQDPPEAIPLLLAKRQKGFAAVFAGRRGRYESIGRHVTSRLFKTLLRCICGVPADAGLFVVLDRVLVKRMLQMDRRRPFVVAMIGCAGMRMTSLPVARSRRLCGRSSYSAWGRLRSGLRAVFWVLRWKLSRRRAAPHEPAGGGCAAEERFPASESA
ncbi:MAG TPA: glycosyltransferase family 2 protein [Planctomycetota bacterium]|nr:glycosyltransferase family 2 protein [Planctomycetota bacterium]